MDSRLLFPGLILIALVFSLALAGCRITPPETAPPTPTEPLAPSPSPTPSPAPTVPAPDISPPYLAWSVPAAGSSEVAPDSPISLRLTDDGSSVDASSVALTVAGNRVNPAILTDGKSCNITYQPDTRFAYKQIVDIEVYARDLAPARNGARIAFSFTVTSRPRAYPPFLGPTGNIRLAVFYYGKHQPEMDSLIADMAPQYLIANPPHGLWGEVYGYNTGWLLQNISKYQSSGVKIIGYITGGYEGRGSGSGIELKWYTLELNKRLIEEMATIDKVDGVFIDECAAFPNEASKQYLKELTDLAHSHNLLTWGNVGSTEFDEWFFTGGGFDMMNSTEQWQGQALTRVQREWGDRISVTGFAKEYSAQDAYQLTVDAWQKGLAYCYISESGYGAIPSWSHELLAMLKDYQKTASAVLAEVP